MSPSSRNRYQQEYADALFMYGYDLAPAAAIRPPTAQGSL